MKKKLILMVATIVVVGTITGIAVSNQSAPTHADTSPLVTQVDSNTKELANHEARITNTESDVKDLQGNTNTGSSSNKVVVPPVVATDNNTVPGSTPITVIAFQEIPLDSDGNIDCKLTYSDNTSFQWHWKIVNPQGSWSTNGIGQNGHWLTTTQTDKVCDQTTIGTVK